MIQENYDLKKNTNNWRKIIDSSEGGELQPAYAAVRAPCRSCPHNVLH